MLSDPRGVVARIGDSVVWSGPTGQKVLGGLETLAESQSRIESAVVGIESAQVAMQGTLGVVQSLSIATLGITSLTEAFMAYRLQALNKRIDVVAKAIKDVEGKIDAQHKAHLKSSLQFLREYDDSPDDRSKISRALDEARRAANIYGDLAMDEASGPARLPVLNCRGRFYVISLLTELRCMMSCDDSKQAVERIAEEQHTLKKIASACFDQTIKTDPEKYLRTCFQPHGVNLDLLTSIYQQAKRLGIIDQPQIADANDMFEHLRNKLSGGIDSWNWQDCWNWMIGAKLKVKHELQKLRYRCDGIGKGRGTEGKCDCRNGRSSRRWHKLTAASPPHAPADDAWRAAATPRVHRWCIQQLAAAHRAVRLAWRLTASRGSQLTTRRAGN